MQTETNESNAEHSHRLMTSAEVAALLRTNRDTLRYWRHTNYGPRSIKVGRHVVYLRADVEQWVSGLGQDQP